MSPAKFEQCVADGGKVRTKDLGDGKYMHICIPKGGGPSVGGEVKHKKDEGDENLKSRYPTMFKKK